MLGELSLCTYEEAFVRGSLLYPILGSFLDRNGVGTITAHRILFIQTLTQILFSHWQLFCVESGALSIEARLWKPNRTPQL
jgi:hypothetical protein